MTSTPPEAIYFRGETRTPESPQPIHFTEPSTIPVLQNQMDPTFNNTDTHGYAQNADQAEQNQLPLDGQKSIHDFNLNAYMNNAMAEEQKLDAMSGAYQADADNQGASLDMGTPQAENQDTSSSNIHDVPSATTAATLPTDSDPNATHANHQSSVQADPPSLIDQPPKSPSEKSFHSSGPSQSASASPEPQSLENGTGADAAPQEAAQEDLSPTQSNSNLPQGDDNEGVDYQALLDTITSSTSTAPPASGVLAATTMSPIDPPPSESAFQPPPVAGLPPRPPPQETPMMHPNYTPGEDIRAYHQPHNANPTANYATQNGNKTFRANSTTASHASLAAAAATGAGANGLPPPPTASFQTAQQPTEQQFQNPRKRTARQRDGKEDSDAPGADDEDIPWGPETQEVYDEFLKEERVYVTEGLWDRFPPGSRLFIGMSYCDWKFADEKRDLLLF